MFNKKKLWALFTIEADMDTVKRVIDEEGVDVIETRDLDDVSMKRFTIATTKRKFNRVIDRLDGLKCY